MLYFELSSKVVKQTGDILHGGQFEYIQIILKILSLWILELPKHP